MAYRVIRTAESDSDLDIIFEHLITSYIAIGDPVNEAFMRAEQRVSRIFAEISNLGKVPHQGTLLPELQTNLRCVTKDRAIFYFQVDEMAQQIEVLAVFFSGQDHRRHIVERLRPDMH
jgi:toxin ParE1/3/4